MILDYRIECEVRDYLHNKFEEYQDADRAVEETAEKFHVTNKDVLDAASLEDYIDILIWWKIIPDIFRYNFLESKIKEEWLNKIGILETEDNP